MPREVLFKTSEKRVRNVTTNPNKTVSTDPWKNGKTPHSVAKALKRLEARTKNWTGGSKNPSPTKPGSWKK